MASLGSPRVAQPPPSPKQPPTPKALPKPAPKALSSYITQVGTSTSGRKTSLSPDQIKERSDRIYREHLFQTFQALKFVKTLPPIDTALIRSKRIYLEKRKGWASRKTLIFDLDETLVHCCENLSQAHPDVILPITFPTGEVVNAGINIRPYARESLKEANRLFEVMVFTASHKCYADVVLDYLDPTGELVHHRLYRDNCVAVEGVLLKDLRVFGNRRLQDLVIVDNAAYSFAYQLDNGIPIISWHDDPYDRELYNLIDYMKVLAEAEDVRLINRDTFHLGTFYEDYIEEFLGRDK
jgi:CTD small phosphatase-like protein 2